MRTTIYSGLCLFALMLNTSIAQTFTGNNQPGAGSGFAFSIGTGVTNLSLSVSNTTSAFSHLYLKCGPGASTANYDYVSRLDKTNNNVNLEIPEFVASTNYSLWVQTPDDSAAHAFSVVLTTNRTDARLISMPVLKFMEFSVTGTISAGMWNYYQVDVPTNLPGWRIVLSCSGTADADVYVQRGAVPTTGSYLARSVSRPLDTIFLDSTAATNQTYFIAVQVPSSGAGAAQYTLSAEVAPLVTLSWEPGTAAAPATAWTNRSLLGGDYFFKVVTADALSGIWRTRLNVQSGEADLFMKRAALPTTTSFDFSSTRPGSDGVALVEVGQYQTNQIWYLMVTAVPGAQWSIYSGNCYIEPLPTPMADNTGGTNTVIAPEGLNFYRTTINSNTIAWRLGLGGLTNSLYVRQGAAAHSYSTAYYDWKHPGQILLVPPYLKPGLECFVTVAGTPGQSFTLDSREQPILEMPFASSVTVTATDYGYVTYHVTVPPDQIAWQLDLQPTSGEAALAARFSAVASEDFNNGFSEMPGSPVKTVTLVPPALVDGSYYVTVYGAAPFTATLTNSRPIVTTLPYAFVVTNDLPGRQGWRFYQVTDIDSQLTSLGWELLLNNQVLGSEIAVRRGAVPGRWSWRTNYNKVTTTTVSSNMDASSIKGFLQFPRHPADIWYIGVNTTNQPLGNFVLTSRESPRPLLTLATDYQATHVANQPAGMFQYFEIDVPTNLLGLELKVANVSSGDPRLVLCRDLLPVDLRSILVNSNAWTPDTSTNWSSGAQVYYANDWTGYTSDSRGTTEAGHYFFASRGNPLEPGVYYLGIVSGPGSTSASEYDLMLRGLYPDGSFIDVPFGGSASRLGVAPHDVLWHRLSVPANTPSLKLRLSADTGDAMVVLRQGGLPNYGASLTSPTNITGCKLQKLGNEHFLMLPYPTNDSIVSGTYYLAVVGEGQNPALPRAGSNTCSFTFFNQGPLVLANLGSVDPLGTTSSVSTQSQEGGEVHGFTFNLVPNTPVIEVRLKDRTGNPTMVLRADAKLSDVPDPYGSSGGWTPTWTNDKVIRVPAPAAGNYTLLVQAAGVGGKYTNSTYTLDISAQQAQPLAYDGGLISVTNQAVDGWKYFLVTVPSDVLGWDLRLTNVTSGDPRMVICRDSIPFDMSTKTSSNTVWTPYTATNWPSGFRIAPDKDWTGYTQSGLGTNETGRFFTVGMGNPLEAGTYIIGVTSGGAPGSATSLSYQLVSRGIGTNQSIVVQPLPFAGGQSNVIGLQPHDFVFYSVNIPSNTPSWQVRLAVGYGEGLLVLRKDGLPNFGATNTIAVTNTAGCKLQKLGNEHFVLLPNEPAFDIPAGTYYLGVVSEGLNPSGTRIGTNSSSFALQSFGTMPITDLGTVDDTNAIVASVWQEGGSVKAFQYNVRSGVLAVVTRLSNRVGNPSMTLMQGGTLPRTMEVYGRQGGWVEDWKSTNYIRIDQPAGGPYTLLVHAGAVSGQYPDASYTLLIYSLVQGTIPLAFDGGQVNISGHLTGEWEYFSVDVPTNATGWDLRLTNILSGSPRLVICRNGYPLDLTSRLFSGAAWAWSGATNWPIAAQAAPALDWTGYKLDPGNVDTTGTIFAAGMGGPLEPGHYLIGVSSAPGTTSPMTYTIVSRGIGDGFMIPVTPLTLGTDSTDLAKLNPREAAYYSLQVTNDTPLWKLRLAPAIGEALLAVRAGALPNVGVTSNVVATAAAGGHKFQKFGVENALLGQPTGITNIPPGMYYLAVVGEGRSPQYGGTNIGVGTTDFSLTSIIPVRPTDLGPVGAGTDVVVTNTLEGGETTCYQFSTPPGALGLTLTLENVSGNPLLRLRNDQKMPLDVSSYGQDGGYKGMWESTNRISFSNPTSTVYTVSVLANGADTNWLPCSYNLRVHVEGGVEVLSFDAGSAQVTGQRDLWHVYQVTVPVNALGWDLRLINVTNGTPRLAICRDTTPSSLVGRPELYQMTNWPTRWQIVPDVDWTALNATDGTTSTGRVFQVGMGNPLEPGTYYVGVTNTTSSSPCSYTLVSRGIGTAFSIPVVDVPFEFGSGGDLVSAREASWFRITVPSNTPSWKVAVEFDQGDGLLVAQRAFLPSIAAGRTNLISNALGGKKMQKLGNEHLLSLASGTNLLGGTYYLGVISEGIYPSNALNRIGSGACSFTLSSYGSVPPFDLGTVGAQDLLGQSTLQGGECATYKFAVPPAILAVQVFFEETNGYPAMTLTTGSSPPTAPNGYGADGGNVLQYQSTNVITIANPAPANYSITAQATGSGVNFPDADYKLRVRSLPVVNVNFDWQLNTNGLFNFADAILQDGFSTYYRVQVPPSLNGEPVIGWKLSLSALYGSPRMRVRPSALPDDRGTNGTSAYFPREAVFVPDYLTPGTWYVEVKAAGLTEFTLTSEALRLERPAWVMPAVGEPVTTPGLPASGPTFGDTAVSTDGVPLSGDIDLETDGFHYYAVVVPPGNGGLLRTELDGISGNANLYLRNGAPPTLSHNALGGSGPLYNRALTNAVGTEYGNWVVLDGKSEFALTPGLWYVAVHAAWGSNVRYRLLLSTGEISDLAYAGGSLTSQVLAAGDWRYYRVVLPATEVRSWNFSFSEQRGDVYVYVRDTSPPGQGINATDLIDWNRDFKNHGPYPYYTNAGTFTVNVPPLRPGNVYYLGVRALSDSSFTISSTTGTSIALDGTIAFMGGYVTNLIPPGGVLRYRIDVPDDARRWSQGAVHASTVKLYLDQGSLPTMTTLDHWYSTIANSTNNRALYNSSWPWLPGYAYFLAVTNTSASAQPFSFRMDGKNCSNDDFDNDGLPDCWEIAWFGSIYTYGANSDPDGDGLTNLQEFLLGTDPTVPNPITVMLINPGPTGDGRFGFSAIGNMNRTYRVQASSSMAPGSWVDVTNYVQTSASQPLAVPVNPAIPHQFFRVVYP